jgi:SAM-dependent methyltransferase
LTERQQPEPRPPPGFDRAEADDRARAFFDDLWAESDPWKLDASELDQRRYERQLELLAGRRYERALEIGCAGGSFTRRLAPLCGELVAIDISKEAIAAARKATDPAAGIDFRAANVMELDVEREGTWDLVVITETSYYIGWLYPMFELGWLAYSLHAATRPCGICLLVDTLSHEHGIMSPWLIRTYRDLFRNVGYELESEESMRGRKETIEFEIVLSLFRKAA